MSNAFLAALIFLELNGYECTWNEEKAFKTTIAVAQGKIDKAKLASEVKKNLLPL